MRRLRPSLPPSFLVPCCHKRALHNPLLFSSPPAISPIAFVIRNHVSQSLLLSLSFSCNQQEGEHNTTRTYYYYCQRKITDPIPRWSVREKQRETERERDKRERAIRVSAEIRDGILIRQVSRSLAPSLAWILSSVSLLITLVAMVGLEFGYTRVLTARRRYM